MQNIEIWLHRTVLYNSIYRADDQLLVNQHTYGIPAAQAPVFCGYGDPLSPADARIVSMRRAGSRCRAPAWVPITRQVTAPGCYG